MSSFWPINSANYIPLCCNVSQNVTPSCADFWGINMVVRRAVEVLGILAAIALSGCAMSPGAEVPRAAMCNLPRHHLAVEIKGGGDGPAFTQSAGQTSLADEIRQAYSTPSALASDPVSPSMLFLSGGSQHGAFGAGYLDGWAKTRPDGLPRFKVVTGISTGAILSTFAFLDRTSVAVNEYSINNERKVLTPFVKHGSDVRLTDALVVARRGALGNLAPLRERMRKLIDDRLLREIAGENSVGRRLYVGAVDVDSGEAVAIDMTALAERYRKEADNHDTVAATRTAACYVEAVMASSTVPLAALPVFIDNRMYIDGGARFGVFSDEIGELIDSRTQAFTAKLDADLRRGRSSPYSPSVFVVINGTLEMKAQCGKADGCVKFNADGLDGAHEKWNLIGLAGRSVSILINQVYRLSTSRILAPRPAGSFQGRLARIGRDAASFNLAIDGIERSCADWEHADTVEARPVEFHPRYMRCLIAYGAKRGAGSGWREFD